MKTKPIKDDKHLNFIRKQPCIISQDGLNCNGEPVVPHHITFLKDESRMSGKAGDDKTVPLCAFHHGVLHHMGEKAFWETWEFPLRSVLRATIDYYLRSK